MQSSKSVASLICSLDLDKEVLGWDNGTFYSVSAVGRIWQKFWNTDHCNYELVVGKIREFLETYEGDKKSQVSAQLMKLELRLKATPSQSKGEAKPPLPIKDAIKRVQKTKVKEMERAIKREERYYKELTSKYMEKTFLREEYLPFIPYDIRSCRFGINCPAQTIVSVDPRLEERYGYLHANNVSLGEDVNFIATLYPLNHVIFWLMVFEKGNVILTQSY